MTKITLRDRVWNATLSLAEEKQDRSAWGRRFKAADVADHMDDPPSMRTVRETVKAIAFFGYIQEGHRKGQYEPIEAEEEPEQERSRSIDQAEIDAIRELESLEERLSYREGLDELRKDLSRIRLSWVDARLTEQIEKTPQLYVADLDLPGEGETRQARQAAVKACYERLRAHGSATKTDFLENVRPEHPAEYDSKGGWWNAIGKQGLRQLARTRDDISAPVEGGHVWHYAPVEWLPLEADSTMVIES